MAQGIVRLVRSLLARSIVEIAFVLSAVGLVAAGSMAFYSFERSTHNDEWVLHTAVVLMKLERLHLTLAQAESAGRGFLVSGAPSAYAAYEHALASIDTQLAEVRSITADNPVQQEALNELKHVAAIRFAYLTGTASLRTSEGVDAVVKSIRGHGSHDMRAIGHLIERMQQTEERLLAVRRAERDRSDALLRQAIAVFLALGGIIIVGVFWQMKRLWRARIRAEAAAVRESHYDALTGLPNERLLRDRLGVALSRARRHDEIVAVFAIDLDAFAAVNERLGREAGDELLQLVGNRLKCLMRPEDTAARVGGDEFLIVLGGLVDPAHAQRIGERLVGSLAEPFTCGGEQIRIGASIGIALYPAEASTGDELLRHAQQALQCAQRREHGRYASVSATAFAQMEPAA